ncbi:uncharacterized protein LOC130500056 [Raphanus sativus]|uniref:Uncharacterized protein LOC130500056 n=1 Tax=Raphanus sativus TaxID=3726 RepID=A0A9W3CH24_RAPSA|nr:uncharacterized protein LOC130500056 [Raphanus sativus]
MSQELPKRIFKEGEETQVTQINNNCRIDFIIRKLEEWLPNELREVKKDPVFSQIFKLHENGLGFSARVIHSFLCRELVTYKQHELWFVFVRRAFRFSLQEFHAVTGLQCDTSISLQEFSDWDDDDGFWSRVVMDLEKLCRYPWGVAAYDFLCESVVKTRDFLSEKTTSYVFDGFSYALQIWAMEAVPKIGKLCGKKLIKGFKDGPRCVNWMGAAKVSYDEIIHLESIFTNEDVTFPYISWTGNMDVVEDDQFRRAGDVRDDRIIVLKEMISKKYDFSEHIWEYENTPEISLELNDEAVNVGEAANGEGNGNESDEDFQTPRGSTSDVSSRKGKKRLPDRGMEKRKHKRLQKQMDEKFEQMKAELRDSRKEATVEVELGDLSPRKPSPSKPSPRKPSTSQSSLRRSKRGEPSESAFDVHFSQEDDIIHGMGTQGVNGLSQASYVTDFDPSQTPNEDDWWTPMSSVRAPPPSQWKKWYRGKTLQLSDSPLPLDGSPQSSLYNFSEESWKGFTDWALNPISLPLGPTILNLFLATREMDAFMFMWRVKTTLNLWAPKRVAFMSAMFCLQVHAAFIKFSPNRKAYKLTDFLLGYGRGELPSHGRTDQVWGVDVDRLYFPLFVNVEVYDCGGGKNRQHVEKFAALIPRIVKAVAPPERQKPLLLSAYTIVDVPMKKRLNKSCCDCGVYALKHLECLLLGLDISLVDDEIIMGCRQKLGVDLWEGAHEPIYAEAMTRYVPSPWERSEAYDLED